MFLLRKLGLNPYAEWNVAFFAADAYTSLIMKTPFHPGFEIPGPEDVAVPFVLDQMQKFAELV